MSETDPVNVTVELINNTKKDIEKIKGHLKSLEKDIGVNLNIDDDGDIDWAKMEIENLEDVIDVLLDIDEEGFDEVLAKKELLKKDTNSTHKINTELDDDLQAISGFDPPSSSGGRSWMDDFPKADITGSGGSSGPDIEGNDIAKRLDDLSAINGGDATGSYGLTGDTGNAIESLEGRLKRKPDIDPLGGHALFEGWSGKSKVSQDIPTPGGSGDSFGPDGPFTGSSSGGPDFLEHFNEGMDNFSKPSGMFEGDDPFDQPTRKASSGSSRRTFWDGKPGYDKKDTDSALGKFSENLKKSVSDGLDNGLESSEKRMRDFQKKVKGNYQHGVDIGKGDKEKRDSDKGGLLSGILPDGLFGDGGKKNPLAKGGKGAVGGLGKSMKSMIPTVRTWMSLIAVILPMIITLAAAIGGLVVALGAVAVAAGAAFAFGAWGLDDFQGRLQSLKDQLSSLFEPVKETFAPFVRGFMGSIPGQLQQLVEPLKELSAFEGTIEKIFGGLVSWVAEGIDRITGLKSEINEILSTFGGGFGSGILDFLEWLVKEAANNKEQFLALASVLGNIIATIYHVSKAVSFAVSNFAFLFGWLETVAGFLDNKFVIALLTGVMAIGALALAMKSLILLFGILSGGIITSAVTGLTMYIAKALVAIGVNTAMAASIAVIAAQAMILIGALIIVANLLDAVFGGFGDLPGMSMIPGVEGSDAGSGPGFGGSGGGLGGSSGATASSSGGDNGGNMYLTIEGDADKDSINKLSDKMESSWQTYSTREEEREK